MYHNYVQGQIKMIQRGKAAEIHENWMLTLIEKIKYKKR